VKGHTTIVGLADQAQFQPFDSGDYDFRTGVHPSATTTLVTPVQNALIYPVSAKGLKIASHPVKKPFATLLLPKPREIVAWNADPITISSRGSAVSVVSSSNLATLTILRYDYQEGDALEVKTGAGTFWKPTPQRHGTERIMVIGFLPKLPGANEDEHKHATDAFNALTAMLGLKWIVSFDSPPANFQRNRPFDPKWPLAQDLLDFIDQIPVQTKGMKLAGHITSSVELFGTINDCKAPNILVTR
jgi:hypothetical protein